MRRAIRYGRSIGLVKPFMHETVQTVFSIMDEAYPELKESSAFILNVVRNEEEKFLETLETGLKLLEVTIQEIKPEKVGSDKKSVIPGDVIFKLYDTFGFPVDIITDHVKEMKIDLDMDGFNLAMEEQKARSRSIKKFAGIGEAYKTLTSEGVKTSFEGYGTIEGKSKVLMIVKEDKEIEIAKPGDSVEIVTRATVFYAESGGQAGDSGRFENENCIISILDTVKNPSGLIIHKGVIQKGEAKKGDLFSLKVDEAKRQAIASNHSATHILQSALRKVLGDHVKQSGSLVTDTRLRFDFTHFAFIPVEELLAIENEVNLRIRENHPVETKEMNMDEAVRAGATALFEEKYGDVVRVVSQGKFSSELCGGTHTKRSGDIGLFKILSEAGIASGVRRIEAATGQVALDHVHREEALIESTAGLLKGAKEDVAAKVEALLKDKKNLEKELESLKAKMASKSVENLADEIKVINGIKVIAKRVDIENPSQLRDLADKFKTKIVSGVILLGAISDGKALLISVVTEDLTKKFKAGDIVKTAAKIVGGGGGGRPDMAQAGGTQPENLDKALESVYQIMS
jgi:alanyl-tRNA synthetase